MVEQFTLPWIISPRVDIPGNELAEKATKGVDKEAWKNFSQWSFHCSVEIKEKFVKKNLLTRNFDHRLQVVLNRLKIGRTRLTRAYPIWIFNQPICDICNCQITLNTIRNHYRIKRILSENHCDKNQILRGFLVFERHRYLTKFN